MTVRSPTADRLWPTTQPCRSQENVNLQPIVKDTGALSTEKKHSRSPCWCTSTSQRRLALTMEGRKMTSMFQVIPLSVSSWLCIQTCHSRVDCLKGRQRPSCHHGTTDVAGVHMYFKTVGNSEFTCVQALLLASTQRTDVYVYAIAAESWLWPSQGSELSLCQLHF